ncbi:hypothetical protein NQ314_019848 [Rhamnusium bicolor]|uniref:PiggyBac transposable element-derived protein domain-containing protein n=1 Tax=Rhamnusium bicolor TaxID=1586634 RepID=A0AAV8WN06_9CUCU|nr:hypothetical protein NQ314_019848 [Rhamnusium bicolor]
MLFFHQYSQNIAKDYNLCCERKQQFVHNTDSEQENSMGESDVEETSDDDYFLGKDEMTKWCKKNVSTVSKTKSKNLPKIVPGPNGVAREVISELSAFDKIIDTNIIDDIVKYTNLYIDFKRNTVGYKRDRDAKHTTQNEITALLGLLYFIDVQKGNHTNVKEQWDTESGFIITRQVMSYKRFLFLLRCMRFDDCDTREDGKNIDKSENCGKLIVSVFIIILDLLAKIKSMSVLLLSAMRVAFGTTYSKLITLCRS